LVGPIRSLHVYKTKKRLVGLLYAYNSYGSQKGHVSPSFKFLGPRAHHWRAKYTCMYCRAYMTFTLRVYSLYNFSLSSTIQRRLQTVLNAAAR